MVELIIAALVLANPVSRWLGLAGGVLAFLTPFVTLSFFNPPRRRLGYAAGACALWFPLFIGRRTAGIKDTLMLAGAVVMADSAVRYFTATY